MSLLADYQIKALCQHPRPMITPFHEEAVNTAVLSDGTRTRIPSYGLSSGGYDITLAPEFKLFTKPNDGRIIDILNFQEEDIVNEVNGDSVTIPPGGLLLGRTQETFAMPHDVMGVAVGKSTWARVGANVLITPLEPGWEGELVVEIVNGTSLPLKIYANMGIAQILFFRISPPDVSYSDRAGKYQHQTGVTTSKL